MATAPIFSRTFKSKYLKKHTSLLAPADPAKGLFVTCNVGAETRALGQVRNLLDVFLPLLYPNYVLLSKAPEVSPNDDSVDGHPAGPRRTKLKTRLSGAPLREKRCAPEDLDATDGRALVKVKRRSVRTCSEAGRGEESEVEQKVEHAGEERKRKNVEDDSSHEQKRKPSRFEAVNTAVAGTVFFRFRIDVNPVEFVGRVFDHIASLNPIEQKDWLRRTDACRRFLPIQVTCAARPDLLALVAKPVVEESALLKSCVDAKGANAPLLTWAIFQNSRKNPDMERDKIVDQLARVMPPKCRVDLNAPDVVILVEVFKSACGFAVLSKDYFRFRKYNLKEFLVQISKTSVPVGQREAANNLRQS